MSPEEICAWLFENLCEPKLFGKQSRVSFIPYGVGLKDERPTSNIERPTPNEKTNIQY
jgi:hypothetical protein